MFKNLLPSVSKKVGGFLFPPICIVCKKEISCNGIGVWLCETCQTDLEQNAANRDPCMYCGLNKKMRLCKCTTSFTSSIDNCFSVFDFDETLKSVIHEFKYGGLKQLAFTMGKVYGANIPVSFFDGMDVITAIPLHFFRYLKRGYNQADYFAMGILAQKNLAIVHKRNIVHRKKSTKTQTHLLRDERLDNMIGAFAVYAKDRAYLENKGIIIVDDVVTTGATTGMCAKVLREAGAKSVKVLSLARD